jgi:hypothetical protein
MDRPLSHEIMCGADLSDLEPETKEKISGKAKDGGETKKEKRA